MFFPCGDPLRGVLFSEQNRTSSTPSLSFLKSLIIWPSFTCILKASFLWTYSKSMFGWMDIINGLTFALNIYLSISNISCKSTINFINGLTKPLNSKNVNGIAKMLTIYISLWYPYLKNQINKQYYYSQVDVF